MLQLQAVNILLNAIGESQIEEIETEHPLHQQAIFVLEQISLLEQNKDLWFNSYETTLVPIASGPDAGKLAVPTDAIKVVARRRSDLGLIKRGEFLFDINKRTAVIDRPVQVTVTEHWPFEELPDTFAMYITAMAAAQFAASHDAEQAKLNFLAAQIEIAKIPHTKEQLQQIKVNLDATSSAYRHTAYIRGNRYNP